MIDLWDTKTPDNDRRVAPSVVYGQRPTFLDPACQYCGETLVPNPVALVPAPLWSCPGRGALCLDVEQGTGTWEFVGPIADAADEPEPVDEEGFAMRSAWTFPAACWTRSAPRTSG